MVSQMDLKIVLVIQAPVVGSIMAFDNLGVMGHVFSTLEVLVVEQGWEATDLGP